MKKIEQQNYSMFRGRKIGRKIVTTHFQVKDGQRYFRTKLRKLPEVM